jgi:hypothetical protein
MNHDTLIQQYLAGPGLLRRALAGMTREQLLAKPIPGKWSTQEVVCHLADYEPIYADRMKRVIALKEPELLKGDPGLFAVRLAYDQRDVEEELTLIEIIRKQMARILRALKPEDFQRQGGHSRDGALTLEVLLQRITAPSPRSLHRGEAPGDGVKDHEEGPGCCPPTGERDPDAQAPIPPQESEGKPGHSEPHKGRLYCLPETPERS